MPDATRRVTVRILLGLVVVGALAGGIGAATAAAAPGEQQRPGGGTGVCLEDAELADLSEDEIDSILFMREEEKLARDIYEELYELWNHRVFRNIARSEQAHMDALGALVERYGLDDPVEGSSPGVFESADLQALYDELVAQGSESLIDALRVGATVEEIDILDLERHIAETEAADVARVYQNLLRGSHNHLRAFVRTLERQTGEPYVPRFMDREPYDEIIAAEGANQRMVAGVGPQRQLETGEGYAWGRGVDADEGPTLARGRGFGAAEGESRGFFRGWRFDAGE